MSAPGDRPRGRSAGPSRRAGTVPARTPAAPRRDRLPPGAPAHRLTGGPTGARQAARPGAARQTAGHRRARAERRHRRRLRLLGTGITLALLALVARLAFVQVLDGSRYAAYASGETQHEVVLPATRGAIYDRSGDLLAISVPRADVIADDFQITRPERRGRHARARAPPVGDEARPRALRAQRLRRGGARGLLVGRDPAESWDWPASPSRRTRCGSRPTPRCSSRCSEGSITPVTAPRRSS